MTATVLTENAFCLFLEMEMLAHLFLMLIFCDLKRILPQMHMTCFQSWKILTCFSPNCRFLLVQGFYFIFEILYVLAMIISLFLAAF